MSQLYFNYGVMGSSKTANALMVHFNYKTIGKNAILVKPKTDVRYGQHIIRSRVGIEEKCYTIDDLMKLSNTDIVKNEAIIVDEAQFLSPLEVDWLSELVDKYDIPVICYGLRADFKGNLFPGSKRLLEIADKISEIKTICWCGRKATFNARFNRLGEVLKSGEQILLGDNDSYIGLCRKHWKIGDIGDAKRIELGILLEDK